jgi:hypothetical protein
MEASMARVDQSRWQGMLGIARFRELLGSRLDEIQRQQPVLTPGPFRKSTI